MRQMSRTIKILYFQIIEEYGILNTFCSHFRNDNFFSRLCFLVVSTVWNNVETKYKWGYLVGIYLNDIISFKLLQRFHIYK